MTVSGARSSATGGKDVRDGEEPWPNDHGGEQLARKPPNEERERDHAWTQFHESESAWSKNAWSEKRGGDRVAKDEREERNSMVERPGRSEYD